MNKPLKRTISLFPILLFSLLSVSLTAFSFNPKLKTGLNISQQYGIDYGYEEYEVDKGIRWGVNAGVSFDFPVNEVFSVSQEFIYTTKGASQTIRIKEQPIELQVFYRTDYLEFPTLFLLHYFRRENFALYYQSGFALSYLVYARYELEGTVETGQDEYELCVDKKMKTIDQFDYGIILGGGIEFKLFEKRLVLDYRINFGIPFIELPTTEDVFPEEQGASRVKLRNQTYSVSLGYFF